jgi:predicted phage-related endonuclease
VTEDLTRRWFELNSGLKVKDVQRHVRHPVNRWMGATLDGIIGATGAVYEAQFMLPWSFSEEAAAAKHMAQLQHNMWVINARSAVLSIITGGGKWVELRINADPLYQHRLLTAERKFWRRVETGEAPSLFGIETPAPTGPGGAHRRHERVELLGRIWRGGRSRDAFLEHEAAKAELKKLLPQDRRPLCTA